jgi:hypothetical protein
MKFLLFKKSFWFLVNNIRKDRPSQWWKRRRVVGCVYPHASLPLSKVAQDAFDDRSLVHKGDDPYLVLAVGE